MALEQQLKVFREGPVAETTSFYLNYALGMLNNGSWYPVDIQDNTELQVVTNGRENAILEVDELVMDDNNTSIVASAYDYLDTAQIMNHPQEYGTQLQFTPYHFTDEDEEPVTAELLAVDMLDLEEALKFVLDSVIATAYMAGRKDAIEDLRGSNEKRFVRAKHLAQVIDFATRPQDGEFGMFTQNSGELVETLRSIAQNIQDSEVKICPLPITEYNPHIDELDRLVRTVDSIQINTASEEK